MAYQTLHTQIRFPKAWTRTAVVLPNYLAGAAAISAKPQRLGKKDRYWKKATPTPVPGVIPAADRARMLAIVS